MILGMKARNLTGFAGAVRLAGVLCAGALCARAEEVQKTDVARVVRDAAGETPLEGAYRAHVARPTSAKPLMTDENGLPLVWSNALGRGRVLAVACDKFIPARFTAVAHQTEKAFEPQFNDLISGKGGLGLLKHLFRRVQAETMPIAVEGSCQWGVNRTEKGHLVWAFNNAGVIKWADDAKDEDCHAVWENKGYLTPERGGVAFWVCPEDWDGTSTNFRAYFPWTKIHNVPIADYALDDMSDPKLDLVNQETLKPVEVAGDEIRVTVPARDYVLLGNCK